MTTENSNQAGERTLTIIERDYGVDISSIERPQDGFYTRDNGCWQPYPEQCPIVRDGNLFEPQEHGPEREMEITDGAYNDNSGSNTVVFRGSNGWWIWDDNNGFTGWTYSEAEEDAKATL